MLQRLRQAVLAFAAVLLAYGLYAALIVPLVEPALTRRASSANADGAAEKTTRRQVNQEQLTALFPPDAWELAEPMLLETERGLFLFREYQPQEDGRMNVTPCTLIYYSSPNKVAGKFIGRPIIMTAPGGAQLQFEKGSDTLRADFGKLLGGRLPGEIRIYSPETEEGAGDALEIQTSNIQIDENRIWTPQRVEFRFGDSFGSGRDLNIVLAPPSTTKPKEELGPSTGNLKLLELVHLERLHLVMRQPEKAITRDANSDSSPAATAATQAFFQGEKETTLEVVCRGAFRFDFEEYSASFEDHVDVARLAMDGPSDQLNCDLLTLYLARKDAAAAATATPNVPGTPSTAGRESAIERVVAEGRPAILRAPSAGATARGEHLEYNLKTRRVLLRDSSRGLLQRDQIQVEAPFVEYEFHIEPARLGRLWCEGPGELNGLAGKDQPQPIFVSWGKKLLLRPHLENHVLSLTSGARLRYGGDSDFAADDLHVWLNEFQVPVDPNEPLANSGVKKKPEYTVAPDRVLAQGNVQLDSAQLAGKVKRLEGFFRQDEQRGGLKSQNVSLINPSVSNAGNRSLIPVHNDPRGSATQDLVPVPDNLAGPTINPHVVKPGHDPLIPHGVGGSTPSRTPTQKYNLTGDLLRLNLVTSGDQTFIDDVNVEGQVRFSAVPAEAMELPLTIIGEVVAVRDANTDRGYLSVTGRPAKVEARGMTMIGDKIEVSQAENRVWMEGPGQALLPPQAMTLQPGNVLYRNDKVSNIQADPVTVTWQEGMNFDGSTIRFTKQVDVRGKQWGKEEILTEWVLVGSTLTVTLDKRIDFSQKTSTEKLNDVSVQRLAFIGNVLLNARSTKDGAQLSYEQLQLNNLTVAEPGSPQGGRVHGDGPGWLSTVRFGNEMALGGLGGTNTSSAPSTTYRPPQLINTVVQFQRAMEGDLGRKQVTFLDGVKCVYGPVADWDQRLPFDNSGLGKNGVLLSCNQLTVNQALGTALEQQSFELAASGNATAEGREFMARSQRISYSQAKDLLILDGDGRAHAELWKLPTETAQTPDLVADHIEYRPHNNQVKFERVHVFHGKKFNTLPNRR